MLNVERAERKIRRDSLENLGEEGKAADKNDDNEEFSKTMMNLYDDDELKERKKE